MKKIIILIILFFCVNIFSQKSLNGLVVIIDPGHGGCDLGAPFLSEQGKILNENAYNYDVSLRLVKLLKSNGAKVFKTTRSERTNIQDTSYLESCTKAIFSLDRSIVQSGLIGLSKRVYFSNLKRNKYSYRKIVFISIHFDISRPDYFGTRIIKGVGSDRLSNYLKDEFANAGLLSNSISPIITNGDRYNFVKHLYVLSNKNKITQKVLIELGNLTNQQDLKRVQDFKIRDKYALVILKSLEKYNKK